MGKVTSLGLFNVNEMIKISCGERYGLSVWSGPRRGCAVHCEIPVRFAKPLSVNPAREELGAPDADGLAELASRLAAAAVFGGRHCSVSTLSHLFSSFFGKSVRAYLSDIRLSHARDLLLGTELPVTTIALDVGFQDSNYFSRVFSRAFGVSPRAFRDHRDPLPAGIPPRQRRKPATPA